MSNTKKRERPLSPSKLKIGDRVTLGIKNITCYSEFSDQKLKDKIAGYVNNTRLGTVKEVFVKTNKRGDRRHFASILWDGMKSTTEHEQNRLKVHEASVVAQELEKPIKVDVAPKQSTKKSTTSVTIFNLQVVEDKEVFTAKTENGYVGCARTTNGICFTSDVFSSALEAANKARNLKRLLENPTEQDCKETKKKTKETTKCVVKKTNKKVTLRSRLYTLDETKAMPLLRFQEVWVIIKDSMYVSECLDKERRNLVSYTSNKEKAMYFTCHEKAKMTMRVLKGTVGPGFDLKRFFIENK